ncbi:MAG: YgaP family membrane protein [Mycobacterium sp.]
MTVDRGVRIMAGVMILLSLGLAQAFGQINLGRLSWLWFTVFIGLNLLQSGITGFCAPAILLRKLGLKSDDSSCRR